MLFIIDLMIPHNGMNSINNNNNNKKLILGWISRRWDVCIWTGLGWPRIGTGGGCL